MNNNIGFFRKFSFTVGKNPSTSPAAKKVVADFDHALALALAKRAAAQKGKGNLEGTLLNAKSLLSFVTQFVKNTAVQAVPLAQGTVKGTLTGLGTGIEKGGLVKGKNLKNIKNLNNLKHNLKLLFRSKFIF